MDKSVQRALEKWPNVPANYGWLRLDRRGRWLIQNEPISHPKVIEFIDRNYLSDRVGRWFFQNGPQKVYVELDYTPWIYGLYQQPEQRLILRTHTQLTAQSLRNVWIDEFGDILLETEWGIGLLDNRDLVKLFACLQTQDGRPLTEEELDQFFSAPPTDISNAQVYVALLAQSRPLLAIRTEEVPKKYGFQPKPKDPKVP